MKIYKPYYINAHGKILSYICKCLSLLFFYIELLKRKVGSYHLSSTVMRTKILNLFHKQKFS